MKRVKRHKIKQEMAESSTSRFRDQEEHDLAYYIHDRVELMHQVFSVIKPKELKAMAPESVYHISVDDLQELCTEELLGISSKRLCAILDGAEPPSDTESSSSEHLETISLDSISSDDEILSQHSSKKKHKHRKHKSKGKHKRKNSKSSDKEAEGGGGGGTKEADRSRASRAGLTVLELLELQARARAIRAQLKQDNAHPAQALQPEAQSRVDISEDEVEIKEEPAEVVEISSEDEKPNIEQLPVKPTSPRDQTSSNSKTVTKRVNDLIVTVPQAKQNKKIVLNRNKNSTQVTNNSSETRDSSEGIKSNTSNTDAATNAQASSSKENKTKTVTQEITKYKVDNEAQSKPVNNKPKLKKKQKKKEKKLDKEEDHDEITLQLSDSEKMDLLEDFDRKNYENFTSSSEDSESSSESESENDTAQVSTVIIQENDNVNSPVNTVPIVVGKASQIPAKPSDEQMHVIERNEQVNIVSLGNSDKTITENLQPDKGPKAIKDRHENESSGSSLRNTEEFIENDIKNRSSNVERDANKTTFIQIMGNNKTRNMEIETSESKNEVNVGVDNHNEKYQVLQSIIVQVRNDNFTESKQCEAHTMRSVIVSAENENFVQTNSENHLRNDELIKVNITQVQKTNDGEIRSAGKSDSIESIEEGEITNTNKDLSEGEITDNEEQEDTQTTNNKLPNKPEVVCVSDEEGDKSKKKKKKDKKSKKEKKSKKSKSDFRESADQNFFRKKDNTIIITEEHGEKENISTFIDDNEERKIIGDISVSSPDIKHNYEDRESIGVNNKEVAGVVSLDDEDDIYEILEISDDSSCYEVDGISVSKEPTAAEIVALSAKIDEINTDDVIILKETEGENENEGNELVLEENQVSNEELKNLSWRDRYLGSNKVKRVLTTSNILNALRNKNKELKRKLEVSKKKLEKEQTTEGDKKVLEEISEFVEGSIQHFNTLQGSTKYVDPVVPEVQKNSDPEDKNKEENQIGIKEVTKEMEKDAKQLLKMYKRLLKYNDMNKKKDPNKKKKKKHKKNKEKDKEIKVI